MFKTLGISPKVLIPAVGQAVVGVLFLLFGLDVEGKTALLSAAATFGVGYAAPAAPVGVVHDAPPEPDAVDEVG